MAVERLFSVVFAIAAAAARRSSFMTLYGICVRRMERGEKDGGHSTAHEGQESVGGGRVRIDYLLTNFEMDENKNGIKGLRCVWEKHS